MASLVDQPAPDRIFDDPRGKPIALSDFFREGPLVLVFLRHFGCGACIEHITELAAHRDAVRAHGGDLLAVGQATPRAAESFRRRYGLGFPVLGDPDHDAFQAYGVERGDARQVFVEPAKQGPQFLRHLRRSDLLAAASRSTDVFLLGSVLVVDGGGIVRYHHQPAWAGDYPPHEEVLAAVAQAARSEVVHA